MRLWVELQAYLSSSAREWVFWWISICRLHVKWSSHIARLKASPYLGTSGQTARCISGSRLPDVANYTVSLNHNSECHTLSELRLFTSYYNHCCVQGHRCRRLVLLIWDFGDSLEKCLKIWFVVEKICIFLKWGRTESV